MIARPIIPRSLVTLVLFSVPLAAQTWEPRITLQKGFGIVDPLPGEINSIYFGSFGFAPDSGWMPFVQVYLTYDKYSYRHDWITGQRKNITATGIFPSIKIAQFAVIGFGYVFGKQDWSTWTYQDTVSFKGAYSRWSFFLAADIDIYIYQGFYFTFGIYTKRPTNSVAVGVSKRF